MSAEIALGEQDVSLDHFESHELESDQDIAPENTFTVAHFEVHDKRGWRLWTRAKLPGKRKCFLRKYIGEPNCFLIIWYYLIEPGTCKHRFEFRINTFEKLVAFDLPTW